MNKRDMWFVFVYAFMVGYMILASIYFPLIVVGMGILFLISIGLTLMGE